MKPRPGRLVRAGGRSRPWRLAVLLTVLFAARAFGAQPQFWRIEGAHDFLDGETEGVSVDSDGHVRLAPATPLLNDPQAPNVWSTGIRSKTAKNISKNPLR